MPRRRSLPKQVRALFQHENKAPSMETLSAPGDPFHQATTIAFHSTECASFDFTDGYSARDNDRKKRRLQRGFAGRLQSGDGNQKSLLCSADSLCIQTRPTHHPSFCLITRRRHSSCQMPSNRTGPTRTGSNCGRRLSRSHWMQPVTVHQPWFVRRLMPFFPSPTAGTNDTVASNYSLPT